jgi:ribokinase
MSGRPPSVCVTGSFMLDLVMRVRQRPGRGETIFADEFGIFRGGKGFNQAVAARRMGAHVAMIGRLGADAFASTFWDALAAEGIDSSGVVTDEHEGTGVATPLIEADGSNSIVVAPRANMRLTAADVRRSAAQIEQADVLLLQLEVPVEASIEAARIARGAGRTVILNPAPAAPLPDELLRLASLVTPNEVEAASLTGVAVDGVAGAFAAAEALVARGARSVVVTLGAMGAVALADGARLHLPTIPVTVVDTTAAGDAFSGALAVGLAEGRPLAAALARANAAGACAVTKLGAEPSLPNRTDVDALLSRTISG